MTYANARYYNQGVGRFLSQDPVFLNLGVDKRTQLALADPQLLNGYSYAKNNPLVLVDPDGEFIFLAPLAAYAVAYAPVWVPATIFGVSAIGASVSSWFLGQSVGYAIEGDYSSAKQSADTAIAVEAATGAAVTGTYALGKLIEPKVLSQASNKADALKSVNQLPKEAQKSVKSFYKKSSNKYTDFSVTKNVDGTYTANMTKPGDVRGSKAVYTKTFDQYGGNAQVQKTTYDPRGNIVHVKDK